MAMSVKKQGGFTLIELIVVMVVTGIIAATIVVFFKPAFDIYLAVGRRAGLTDLADTALRRMSRDIRLAVPNSIRWPNSQCFELVPTAAGGRYRMGPDTSPGAPGNGWFDGNAAVSVLDVLTPLSSTPAANDWLVIDNQNTNDVYTGTNRSAIASVATPPALDPNLDYYYHRITLQAATQFPSGYDGGRFVVVPNAQNAVFYVCAGTGVDAEGSGTGTLYRFANYGYNAATPAACPVPVVGTTPVLASKVKSCSFVYSPTQGATQQSGFVWMNLEIAEQREFISLVHGTHVDNVP
ncbi:MAG: type II secretion system GspH family protein [Gallionella sp.]|nr:type II secretion system GspH family protein [Gallionella sp.]